MDTRNCHESNSRSKQMKTLKDYALSYQKSNKSIFPCDRNKQPLVNWKEFQNRRPSKEEVEKWWTDFPDANIGIVTGIISGLSVIDCDLGSDYTQFPPTVTIRTGSGGYHLYYRYHSGLGNRAGLLPNVDIRSDGGYVIAYPSVTNDKIEDGVLKKKGGKYERVNKNQTFADFPVQMLGDKIVKKDWSTILSGTKKGSRNQNAAEIIGKMLKPFKITEWEDVWQLLRGWNSQNTPPLPNAELRTVFDSICKREIGNRSGEILTEDDVPVLPIAEVAEKTAVNVPSTPTGIKTLDEILLGGILPGDVIVISGATGQGKTFLSQSITREMAANEIPTLWFSYEVMIGELWRKFEMMGIDKNFISYTPLKMVTGSMDWVEKKIKEAKEKYGTKVVFLDHLGFLAKALKDPNEKSLGSNYSLYLSSLCRDIKRIAIDNEVSIFLLVHRTKDREKIDETSDIAYSAGIAQEADTVMMIRRERTLNNSHNDNIYTKYSFLSVVKNRKTGISKKISMEVLEGRLVETSYVEQTTKKNLHFG